MLGLPRLVLASSRPVPPAPLPEPQPRGGGRGVTAVICHNHVSFRGRLSPAKQPDAAGKAQMVVFPPLFAFVHCDTLAKIILEILLKKKEGKKKGKKARAEGRALSISARLRGLPQSEMKANNALKLLFQAVQSARLVQRGCSSLRRSACREGHGFTAPSPPARSCWAPTEGLAPLQGAPNPPHCS